MKSKWTGLARVIIVIATLALIINAMMAFTEIRKDLTYSNRAYGLSMLDDYFNEGLYEDIYEATLKNELTDEEIKSDISQYEAFGRWYHAYTMHKMYPADERYTQQMVTERGNITWNKIINVMNELEKVTLIRERSYTTD